jgi:hypothetical protein
MLRKLTHYLGLILLGGKEELVNLILTKHFELTYRFLILLIITAFLQKAIAQPGNLVPNPGFEDRIECVYNNGPISDAPPWFRPTEGTPDVFHECGIVNEDLCPYPDETYLDSWFFGIPTNTIGCQEPHSGAGYAGSFYFQPGIAPLYEYREYLAVELLEPLQAGQQYLVSYYVSLAERMTHGIWALQVAFLNEPYFNLSSPTFIPIQPSLTHTTGNFITDKEGWVEISGVYTAQGGELYMYMGNFQANIYTESIDVMNGQSTQSHYLNSAYYYIDDVYVGTDLLSLTEQIAFHLNLWPNPVHDRLNISVNFPSELQIYSVTGALILPAFQINNMVSLDVSTWSHGVYLVNVINADSNNLYRFIKW